MKKGYEEHIITGKQIEEMEDTSNLYVVFEEDADRPKMHDLTKGILDDLNAAKDYAQDIHREEALFVAGYDAYQSGTYDCLYEVR